MKKILLLLPFITIGVFAQNGFKTAQKRYPRVRHAYSEKSGRMNEILKATSINQDSLMVYIRVFKHEKELEIWGKNKSDEQYKILNTYDICQTCGTLGPKRREGDMQIPEGFYHIDAFNPASNYHLSMRVNYPNKSDKKLGVKGKLGGNICIHGSCVTIGCIPITDDKIKEVYLFCIEAKNNGQRNIPVTFFPARLTDKNFNILKSKASSSSEKIGLWTDLKLAYDRFNGSKKLFSVTYLANGRHQLK